MTLVLVLALIVTAAVAAATASVGGTLIAAVAAGFAGWVLGNTRKPAVLVQEVRQDIAARVAAEINAVFEASPRAAVLVDGDLKIIAANRLARRLLRFEELGRRAPTVMRAPAVLDLVRLCAAGAPADSTVWERPGESLDEQYRVYAAPRTEGRPDGALVVFDDLTEAMVTERRRADFLANASHELRTPLAALSLTVETLTGPARGDPGAQARFLGIMGEQITRMRRLIDDLLSLSRIEMDEFSQPTTIEDVEHLLRETIEIVAPAARARSVEVSLSSSRPLPLVADRFQLGQVFANLIDNAIKYSSPGEQVRVEMAGPIAGDLIQDAALRHWTEAGRAVLHATPVDAAGQWAVIRVIDEGPGIERRHLPRLSERFYRIDRDDRQRSGTGLGLAIVKHIIARHRGGFGVESEIGRGTAFAVWLPLADAAGPEVAPDAVRRPETADTAGLPRPLP
jgi:two-component system phosphate regulon sensor histidine kinase PhoR